MELAKPWSRRREIARRLAGKRAADPVATAFHRWAYRQRDVQFVQIGSHDGQANDPLAVHLDRQQGWHGIMVEPVPANFSRLQQRRAEPRFTLIQAAITAHDGSVELNVVESAMPGAAQLASVQRDVAMSHASAIPDFSLAVITVPAMTFETLTHGLADIDVLHIDTEGHDAAILAQVDLDQWTLAAVMFEDEHLDEGTRAACWERLRAHRYKVASNGRDTLALR